MSNEPDQNKNGHDSERISYVDRNDDCSTCTICISCYEQSLTREHWADFVAVLCEVNGTQEGYSN